MLSEEDDVDIHALKRQGMTISVGGHAKLGGFYPTSQHSTKFEPFS